MFIHDMVKRRLLSLLQPWLQEEPELELQLGFLNSVAIAKKVCFSMPALKGLMDDSSQLSFKEFTIEKFVIRFSNWSAPAFTFEAHGVNVILVAEELNEEDSSKLRNSFDSGLKKEISMMDPEGSSLHDILDRILSNNSPKNLFKSSLWTHLLQHCSLQITSLNFRVQSPLLNDFEYFVQVKDVSVESRYFDYGCLYSGIIGVITEPLCESSFSISGSGFDLGYKRRDDIVNICCLEDLFICIKLHDLKVSEINIEVPKIEFFFSPVDFPVLVALDMLSTIKPRSVRNGRQLWRIAASRVDNLIPIPRLSFYNVVGIVSLWLRYVNAYSNLLLLLGYPANRLLKRSAAKLSKDSVFLTSAKQNWSVMSDIEKVLPSNAIAQARRIARYKAASSVQHEGDSYGVLLTNSHFKSYLNVYSFLVFIGRFSLGILWSIAWILRKISLHSLLNGNQGSVSKFSSPNFHFNLTLGKIYVTIHPESPAESANEQVRIGISYSDVCSFCLSIKAFLLMYTEDIMEHSFCISVGKFKVKSFISPIQREDVESDDLKTILQAEPGKLFSLSETRETSSAGYDQVSCEPRLKECLQQMWLNWREECNKLEEVEAEFLENPCLLCEIKSFLTYPELQKLDSGLWKCNLAVQRFGITLSYSSLVSMAVIFGQIQNNLAWTLESGRSRASSNSLQGTDDRPEVSLEKIYECYASRIKLAVLRVLPEKDVQLGLLIAGPHIQVLLGKIRNGDANEDSRSHMVSQEDFCLGFDFQNIEFVAWPTPRSGSGTLNGCSGSDNEDAECIKIQEPKKIDIPKPGNEKYSSHGCICLSYFLKIGGMNVYVEYFAESQNYRLFVLRPLTFQSSSVRQCVLSFGSTFVAFSEAFDGVALGFTAVSFMDELYALSRVLGVLYSAILYAFHGFGSADNRPFQMLKQRDVVNMKLVNEESSAKTRLLICEGTRFLIKGNFKIESVNILLHNSRISSKEGPLNVDTTRGKTSALQHMPECGILISVHKMCFESSYEESKLELLIESSDIQSIIVRYQENIAKSFDFYALKDLPLRSHDCLYEASLSHCAVTLLLNPAQFVSSPRSENEDVHDNASNPVNTSSYTGETRSSFLSHGFLQKFGFASSNQAPTSSKWLLINIAVAAVFVTKCSVKNIMIGAKQFNKLLSSLSVGGKFHKVSWEIQGGVLCLETTALPIVVECFVSYLHRVSTLLSSSPATSNEKEKAEFHTNYSAGELAQPVPLTSQQAIWEVLEAFTLDMSQFSLVLVIEDESGGIREFILEVDLKVDLELANMQRKFSFELSRLSIFSDVLQETTEDEIQILHFSPATSDVISSGIASRESSSSVKFGDGSLSIDESCIRVPDSQEEARENFQISHREDILKHLVACVSAEKPLSSPRQSNEVWVGSGFVSRSDVTISLSELLMILSVVSAFSATFGKDQTSESGQSLLPLNQEVHNSFEDMVPNGAIVAVQDVHQHLYFTVEGGENKYTLGGALHYSLVGERALFKVKYHNQRKWNSSASWFSLISLHAKNDSGEPLRLNCHPGSGFVAISSNADNARALWKTLSCEPESYKGDIDWEPFNQLLRNTFYLVNKKNDCGVAFIDDVPEFVRKPGNPFKLKVLSNLSIVHDVVAHHRSWSLTNADTTFREDEDRGTTYGQSRTLPCISIKIEKVALTIVHEFTEAKDRFPLLQAFVTDAQLILQILSSKARLMSTSIAMLNYYDAQASLWRELLHPVEICTFYRSTFQKQSPDPEAVSPGVPVNMYCRTKELKISLTELSLDTLLFTIGELNLAGPFTVKSPIILADRCKVENQTGLNLNCKFFGEQIVTLGGRQSVNTFLRHPTSASQSPEVVPVASIQLSLPNSFVTSPVQLPIREACVLAWRTRLASLQDSRSFPGPFVVAEISRKSEDGLSIVVSPLIRIHNETGFPIELRFRRPEEQANDFASMTLNSGDTLDDSVASFDAISLSGGLKKTLISLSVGNIFFSFKPELPSGIMNSSSPLSVEWSDELKGGKAVRLSGIFDKLGYEVRKALQVGSMKCSFSTAHCTLRSSDQHSFDMHFLIQIMGREVPITQPDQSRNGQENRNATISLQEQKEIYLLPTVRVSNLLYSEIHVVLYETDQRGPAGCHNIGKEATIPCGSTVDFYANPATIYFSITLTDLKATCKPVKSSELVKRLLKYKQEVHYLDVDLDFGGGKYVSFLRLSRGDRGILEATIYTSYALKNDSDCSLFFFDQNQKPPSWNEMKNLGPHIRPESGLLLPPKSSGSWFLRSHKLRLRVLEGHESEALVDLDALSGPTEICLEIEEGSGVINFTKFGVSIGPSSSKLVPSRIITMVPRHVILNESEESITVRQCNLGDDSASIMRVNSKQKTELKLQKEVSMRREYSSFENFIRRHKNDSDNSLIFIQFLLNESFGWSGPLCISSLGRFFLKFRKQSNEARFKSDKVTEFAAVDVVEEGSTIVVQFHKPPDGNLPYRIENYLHGLSLSFYQKDSSEVEVLGSECRVDYVWDDLTLPHKLVVVINNMKLLREINLDKVRTWKPFYKLTQHTGLGANFLLGKETKDQKRNLGEKKGINMVHVGYEVYAEGSTRVLRICELAESRKREKAFNSFSKLRLRVSQFAIQVLESVKEDLNQSDGASYIPVLAVRLQNITLDSMLTGQQKYNLIGVKSLNVDLKWVGAPFAAMLRRHQLDSTDGDACDLKIYVVLLSAVADVKQVKYSSIILQPLDLNVDEDTLMKLVSFWRTSLSTSTKSTLFYFDHFEIHPIKIIANFLPGDSYSSYNSAQETLRSLLHSVVKVPPLKNMVVELNGILVTHALITFRELFFRCAQHYSWYAMRAISIAKGSVLLPPAFASIFDDLASSSLDVFFDPSRGLMNLPGLTVGTFKLISKCIDSKGFTGTKRYLGDLGNTLRTAGSNVVFAAVTEVSDSILRGAEANGFNGMMLGFHQGILKLAMEPSVLGTALMGGGPDRKIKLDRSPGVDELYIEGYLQAMLDVIYKQEYLRVRVIDDQVILKNLPPNSSMIDEIMDRVKGFLISKALLKGDPSAISRPLRHLHGEREWKIGPTIVTLCEHLFVSFAIRMLRKQANKLMGKAKLKLPIINDEKKSIVPANAGAVQKVKFTWQWGITKFVFSGIVAYIDGRLCRSIPNPVARRVVSGFILSFLDKNDEE